MYSSEEKLNLKSLLMSLFIIVKINLFENNDKILEKITDFNSN
jgi:hypothetical protein